MCLALHTPRSYGQTLSEYPIGTYSIYQNTLFNNPTPLLIDHKGELNVLYQGRTGPYSDVNSMHFSGSYTFATRHLAGFYVATENESEFLRKARYYAKYALSLQLSEKTKLVSGVMMGVVTYQFVSASANTGGSDNKWDASLGLGLLSGRFSCFASMQQVPESRLRPLIYDYALRRYYVAGARYTFRTSEHLETVAMAESRFFLDRKNVYRLSTALEIYNLVNVGIQLDLSGHLCFYGGLRWKVYKENLLQLQVQHIMQNVLNKNGYRLNLFEIGVGAFF